MPQYSHDEVRRHNGPKSLWLIIHNDVYDVTKFLNEHPGGEESLLDFAGQDCTTAFEDVGHSEDARKMMCKYKIGTLPAKERTSHHNVCMGLNSAGPGGSTEFPWKNEDLTVYQVASVSRLPKSKSLEMPPRIPSECDREQPRTQGRVNAIVVPRDKRRPRGPPCQGSKWKWILLLLATAIVAGAAWKKYSKS